jgi:hypothetical protein
MLTRRAQSRLLRPCAWAAAVSVPVPPAASSNREPAQIWRSRPGLEDDVRPLGSWFVCNSEPETKGASDAHPVHARVDPLPRAAPPGRGHDRGPLVLAVDQRPVEHVKTSCPMATAAPRRPGRWRLLPRLSPRLERRPSHDHQHHRHRRAAGPPPPPPGTRLLRPPAPSHHPSLATRRIRGGCHRGLTGTPRTSWQEAVRPHGALEATA